MNRYVVGLTTLALLPLQACVSGDVTSAALAENQLVRAPQIIGALKCAFAIALEKEAKEGGRKRLDGKVAAVTLTLQIVDTTGASAGAKAVGPAVLVFGAGGAVTPFLNGGVKRTNTVQTTIDFRLRLAHEPEYRSACEDTPNDTRRNWGFEQWLASVISGLEPNAVYWPAGELDSVKYDASFGIQRKADGGAEFNVVFVSGNVGGSFDRNDTQSISFTITEPSDKVQVPTATPGDSGSRTLRIEPPPSKIE